jgi:murein L,D-transpeptidase YcbB/YkuD
MGSIPRTTCSRRWSARAEVTAGDAPLEAVLDYDVLQSEALARLLYHLIFGKVDPRDFDPHWNFTREVDAEEPGEFIDAMLESGALYARIEAQKPRYELYWRLRAELAHQREIAERGGYPPVPEGPKLELGATGPRVAALRARLRASGDLVEDALTGDRAAFDSALAEAVRRFQKRHGLDEDAVLGPGTLAALNVPIAARIAQIRVNLERGRWYLHGLDPTFVVVNVAGFRVYYLPDAKLVWSARAIIGKPFRATPIFRAKMNYLVLNPTWTVPPGILAHDMLPAQRRDPSYLEKKGLQVLDRNGRVVPTSSIDWSKATARSFPYNVVQAPGPDNALGRVKFMFPNSHSVYLHDTPSRNLFDKSERAFSSGCIRVENPLELTALLLEGQKGWDRAAIDAALAAGKTRAVPLEHPVPVLLTYFTAWVDREGVLELRGDVYDRDPRVLSGLESEFRFRR